MAPILSTDEILTLTPQLRATGVDGTPPAEVSLTDWIDDVTTFLTDRNLQDVTLVAHSFAGYVAAGVLERDSGHIRTAVFLDALVPQPGRSWFETMGSAVEQYMSSLAENGAIPWFTHDQLDQLYPGHGISDTDYVWMKPKLTPQPVSTYNESAITEPLSPGGTRLAYVRCLHTTPPAAEITETSPGWEFRTLDTGHWPMITNPAATARVIKELAQL